MADLRRHQRRERRQLLPRRHRRLSPGLSESDRLPDSLRLHRQPGVYAADRRTCGRTYRWHRGYPELRVHGVAADVDLRSGHYAEGDAQRQVVLGTKALVIRLFEEVVDVDAIASTTEELPHRHSGAEHALIRYPLQPLRRHLRKIPQHAGLAWSGRVSLLQRGHHCRTA